jgi:hypothetical protein
LATVGVLFVGLGDWASTVPVAGLLDRKVFPGAAATHSP